MDTLQVLTWLILALAAVLAVAAVVLAVMALTRDLRNASAWKQDEPEIRRAVERTTQQRIEEKMMLNASMSDEFSPRTIFWLWLGFTSSYVVLVQRDQPAGEDEARTVLCERKSVTFRRTGKRFAELSLLDPEGGEPLQVYVCVRPREAEKLERILRRRA